MSSVSLTYNSANRTFTATVTTDPGATVMMVNLSGPGGVGGPMNPAGGNQFTYMYPMSPVPTGTWTATARIQPAIETKSGSTTV